MAKYGEGTHKVRCFWRAAASGVSLAALMALPAVAQTSAPSTGAAEEAHAVDTVGVEEIVVTANKREEAANTVPMSITAATAQHLQDVGVTQPRDLARITPSFHYADSYVGSPIYTLRGVGFSDISLGGRPTVSVYVDQAPLPFAIETRGANLDLQRVEVLRGPQGTLFGQNSTGGAVNYIAAAPGEDFDAGLRVSAGSFGAIDGEGYVSGPLTSTLRARLAVQRSQADDWQRSYTTGATNGAIDFTNARLMLDWTPSEALSVKLNLNAWADRSDVQAGQMIEVTPAIAPLAGFVPGLVGYPLAPHNARAADFNPGEDYGRDNNFRQANLRADYQFNPDLTLTSITSFSHFDQDQLQDIDGTTLNNLSQRTLGNVDSGFEELRVAQQFSNASLVAGLNYAHDKVSEVGFLNEADSTIALAFTPPLTTFRDENSQDVITWAAFLSGDYHLTSELRLSGGARYTSVENNFNGCTSDTGDGVAAAAFGAILGASIAPGACVTADATFTPGRVHDTLSEDNVSWRAGLDWTPADRILLYANVSRGYKAGSFPILAATVASQLAPATQESITSYEAGFKLTLLERTLQLNGAVFHSDYEDKQILGKVIDPFLGPLLRLVNVPHSQINGAELQLTWAPIDGLTVTAAGSYIQSEIQDHFTNFDPGGALRDFNGEAFPNTPRVELSADVNYRRPLSEGLNLVLGANATYEDKTNSQLGELSRLAVDAYTLLDLRAGIEAHDGSWSLTAWGRNVGDVYYWTTGNANLDTTVRFAGMPATFGVTFAIRH